MCVKFNNLSLRCYFSTH